MRSRTSFFNKTMFLKSVTRFWPVWGAYLAIWVLMQPVALLSNGRWGGMNAVNGQRMLLEYAKFGGVIMGAVFAILSVMAVWSFLYNARAAHGMACLPVRREGQYVSAVLAGYVPLLASNAVVALLTFLTCAADGWADFGHILQWFAIVSLIGLFFYGFATLCAQLTGNIIVLPLAYVVLNFVVIGVEELLRGVFAQFVYGMESSFGTTTRYFSPVVGYLTGLDYEPVRVLSERNGYEAVGYRFVGWSVVLIYALVGVAMLIGALLLFRRRRMESAGDVVAVKPLKPVFRWCMGLGAGLCFACLMYVILDWDNAVGRTSAFLFLLIFLIIGAFIGWFAAEMLLKKSFRVFRRNGWAGYGVCCLVIVALMLGMRFDLFGYERYIPNADRVESVIVSSGGEIATVSGPEGVALARELHRKIIADKDWNETYYDAGWPVGVDGVMCRLSYYLKNGSAVSRRYVLMYDNNDPSRGEIAQLYAVMNCDEAIANRKETAFPITRDNINYATVSAAMTAVECAEAAGYASPEEYILCELEGFTRGELAAMKEEDRYMILGESVLGYSLNGYKLLDSYAPASAYYEGVPASYGDLYYPDDSAYASEIMPVITPAPNYSYDDDADIAQFARDLDWNQVYFQYELSLDPAEAWELYSACVQPDLADGTLGRVWVVEDDDYRAAVYNARIEIMAREADPGEISANLYGGGVWLEGGESYHFARFYTVPTTDSVLTDLWLRGHGLKLHTYGELSEQEIYG